jgi:hypothetical protein
MAKEWENMECTYNDFLAQGYLSVLAWHLATTLEVAILKYLADGCSGSRNPTVGNVPKMVANSLWAVLKTHQLMKEFNSHGFKDHPCLMGENGQFMLRNTKFSGIVKLEHTVTGLRGDLSSLKMKTDGLKKTVDQHTTNITKLKKPK